MRGKRFCILCLVLLCTVILITACQGPGSKQPTNDKVQTNAPVPADWDRGFQVGTLQEGESLYVTEYLDLEHKSPADMTDWYMSFSKVSGGEFYSVQSYNTEQGWKEILEVHVPGKAEPEQSVELDPASWNLSEATLYGFDVTGDGYVFLMKENIAGDEEGAEDRYGLRLVYTDAQGAMVSEVDLSPMLQEKGLLQETGDYELYRDQEGYLYLLTAQSTVLLVLDSDGNAVTEYICPGSGSNRIVNMFMTPFGDDGGRMLFPVWLEEGRIKILGRVESGLKELAVLDDPSGMFRTIWCGMYGSSIYYTAETNEKETILVRWDVTTGLREKVLNMAATGYSNHNICMLVEGERAVRFRITSGWAPTNKEDYLVAFSDQVPDYYDHVSLVVLAKNYSGDFLISTVANFSRKNPSCKMIVEMDEDNFEMFRTRTMADIMAGGGPDILVVSAEDMKMLAESGALIPVEQLISRETLDALLPGILQGGTWEGKLMGVACEAVAGTLFTSKNTWAEDSWTLDDILSLAEQKEGLEQILTYGGTGSMPPYNVLNVLMGRNLKNTRFVDLENGVSRFEQENFMRVLEVVKQFSGEGNSSVSGSKMVANGTCLAQEMYVLDERYISSTFAQMGDAINLVGFPDIGGGYISGRGLLVVNAKSENPEVARAFLEYLLSFENQKWLYTGGGSLSVRSDMAHRMAGYYWDPEETYIEEYTAFLKSCAPEDLDNYLFDLAWEEAEAFFSGDKDALTVTRAIDNRVQLYLDERN